MYYGKNAFSLLLRYTLAHEIEEWGWDIGDHTYGAKGSPIIIEAEYAGLKIGKYCSIAREVLMILGNHRPDTITTYPFKNQCNFWPEAVDATDDHSTKGDIVIGNDVWIGARANIMSGVTIGSGAIIATAAVDRHGGRGDQGRAAICHRGRQPGPGHQIPLPRKDHRASACSRLVGLA
ncbi:LbetaH domain-containing protein [Komagataeibacter nataicola]|uniref:hypothetical protein n=1 Tax=Komagataeibacter nataicola TaxID=265960 RepID=UPI002156C4B2|nr:acetyltransferase [Komagataeibacter nataicola NRIC 0616]